ncbi:hypothetical protein D3C72_2207320 [compost metagenome]
MATPGIGLPFSTRVMAMTPTSPPKKAINTSYILGEVRAKSSDCASLNGLIVKYKNETSRLTKVAINKFFNDFFNRGKS